MATIEVISPKTGSDSGTVFDATNYPWVIVAAGNLTDNTKVLATTETMSVKLLGSTLTDGTAAATLTATVQARRFVCPAVLTIAKDATAAAVGAYVITPPNH